MMQRRGFLGWLAVLPFLRRLRLPAEPSTTIILSGAEIQPRAIGPLFTSVTPDSAPRLSSGGRVKAWHPREISPGVFLYDESGVELWPDA